MSENGAGGLALARLTAGWHALANVETVEDAVRVVRGAGVLREAVSQARLGPHAQNEAAQLTIEAQAKAGELLAEMPKLAGARTPAGFDALTPSPPTLAELGVSKFQSHYWQRVAAIPPERRSAYYRMVADNLRRAETEAGADEKPGPLEVSTAGVRAYYEAGVHFASVEDEWLTPLDIIGRTLAVLGTIDLDPCSNTIGAPNVPAVTRFTVAEDGLDRDWHGRVYMNPPYGASIGMWVGKLLEEYDEGRVSAAVALVPARTDTAWFWDFRDSALCFVRGRLRFSGAKASAPFPSLVAYFGPDLPGFASAFGDLGDIWWRYVAS